MREQIRRWVPLGAWFSACTITLVALWSIDQPRFDLPPTSPDQWSRWAAVRDPLDAVAGVARLVTTVAIAYLLLVSCLHLLATAWGRRRARRFTARLNPGPVAAIVATAVLGGAPFAAALDGGSTARPGPDRDDPPPPVMRVLGDGPTTASTVTSTTAASTTSTVVPTMTVPPVAAASTEVPTAPAVPQPDRDGRDDPPDSDSGATPQRSTYTVTQGDNLWVIAERRLRLGLGREATEDEIRGYWLALIDINADRMVEPGNPNLLHPGQELLLPG